MKIACYYLSVWSNILACYIFNFNDNLSSTPSWFSCMSTSEGTVTCTVIPEIWPIFLEWFVCIHDRCKYMFRAIQPSGAGATDALFCCISHLAQTHKPSTAPRNKSESSVGRCLPWFWLLWWLFFFFKRLIEGRERKSEQLQDKKQLCGVNHIFRPS